MKNAFRQSMAWLHTWMGLLVGWILFFMFLTGTVGYFDTEIDRWMRPERPLASNQMSMEQAFDVGLKRLATAAPNAQQWYVAPPGNHEQPDLRIFYRDEPNADGTRGKTGNELLNPATGEPIEYRKTGGGQVLYQMHYDLYYMPGVTANWIVGVCTMFMLVAIVSGVIVHKKIFKDFFTFRPGKQQRSWLDAHNVLSVVALPFHLMITYSGLIFFALTYMPMIVSASYGSNDKSRQTFLEEAVGVHQLEIEPSGIPATMAPLAPILAEATRRFGSDQIRFVDIRNPGDSNARISIGRTPASPVRNPERIVFDGVSGKLLEAPNPIDNGPQAVRDIFLGLHEGLFAGTALRWLYFLSGLLGTAMIGTGLALWTAKRRTQQAKQPSHAGLALVERLNVGTIVGLPIGIAAYFWANRLIPVAFGERAEWEVHAMFIAWAVMLVHVHFRPLAKVWTEQLSVAAGLFLFLPVLNALTTDRHLGITIPGGDWVLAGFDLTVLVVGAAFAATALKVHGVMTAAPAPKRRAHAPIASQTTASDVS